MRAVVAAVLLAAMAPGVSAAAVASGAAASSEAPQSKSAGSKKKPGAKKPAAKKPAPKKKAPAKAPAKKPAAKKKAPVRSDRSEREVRSDKRRTDADIRETNRKLRLNAEETERKLSQLGLVEGEIEQCNGRIAVISTRLDTINAQIGTLNDSISALDEHLRQITATYARALRRQQGRRQQMSALAFVFSSESFAQAYRRLRYLRRFEKWREKRAVEIRQARAVLDDKRKRLSALGDEAARQRQALAGERTVLERRQAETEQLVAELRSEGGALKQVMAQQRRRAEALESELDAVIAREAARRAAEEAARKEAERKEAERKAAERRAAEEAARRAAEEKARKEATPAAASADKAPAPVAESKKKKTDKKTKPVKHGGKAPAKESAPSAASGKEAAASGGSSSGSASSGSAAKPLHTPDAAAEKGTASKSVVTGVDFGSLKGRLPFPIAGNYTIVKKFGRQKHPSLPHVETNNAGIDLETAKGAAVRSVADGEVSAVFRPDGYNSVVVIRHGAYMTVYANLGAVTVKSGDKVKAGQNIGSVFSDANDGGRSVLHFEVRHGRDKENPESWLKR